MKILIGDYKIESDKYQFVIKEEKMDTVCNEETGEVKKVNRVIIHGYFTSFDLMLKHIAQRILFDNDDLESIKEKLDNLNNKVDELIELFKVGGKKQ